MRIISLLASATEIVCALGAGEMLVGRSHECDNPAWVLMLPPCTAAAFDATVSSAAIDAEVRRRLAAAEPLYHMDTDLIQELHADLLIAQAHCEVCAVTPENVAATGCAIASRILPLQAGNLAEIYKGISAIAAAIDRPAAGLHLIAQMQQRLQAVRSATAAFTRRSVVVLEWTDPVFAMANWGPELVQIANGEALLGNPGKHSAAMDWTAVLAADPEFLIITPCGYGLQRAQAEMPMMQRRPGWTNLRAVKNNQVVIADGNRYFNRSGTTVVETAELLADILHGTHLFHGSAAAWEWHRANGVET